MKFRADQPRHRDGTSMLSWVETMMNDYARNGRKFYILIVRLMSSFLQARIKLDEKNMMTWNKRTRESKCCWLIIIVDSFLKTIYCSWGNGWVDLLLFGIKSRCSRWKCIENHCLDNNENMLSIGSMHLKWRHWGYWTITDTSCGYWTITDPTSCMSITFRNPISRGLHHMTAVKSSDHRVMLIWKTHLTIHNTMFKEQITPLKYKFHLFMNRDDGHVQNLPHNDDLSLKKLQHYYLSSSWLNNILEATTPDFSIYVQWSLLFPLIPQGFINSVKTTQRNTIRTIIQTHEK